MCDISTYLSGLLNTERPARSYTQGSAFWYPVGLAPLVQGWVGWAGTLMVSAHSNIKVSATHILSGQPPPHTRNEKLTCTHMDVYKLSLLIYSQSDNCRMRNGLQYARTNQDKSVNSSQCYHKLYDIAKL
jgi:hypothetical protein